MPCLLSHRVGKQKVKFVMTDSDHGMKITDIGAVEDEVDEPIVRRFIL